MRLLRTSTRPLLGLLLLPYLLAAPAQGDGEAGTPLDEHFQGKVTSLEREVVTLTYDFSSPEQVKDWTKGVPFPVFRVETPKVEVKDGRLVITGSTGVSHMADWKGDVSVACQMTLDATRDVGGMLTPPTETNDFATFSVREFFFHSWDRGQQGGQHSIIKFGDQWREPDAEDEFIGFRYVTRKKPQERMKAGATIPFEFGIARKKLYLEIPDVKLKGKDFGVPLEVSRPGYYAVKKGVTIDDVVITGRLSDEWLEANGVALRLSTSEDE